MDKEDGPKKPRGLELLLYPLIGVGTPSVYFYFLKNTNSITEAIKYSLFYLLLIGVSTLLGKFLSLVGSILGDKIKIEFRAYLDNT